MIGRLISLANGPVRFAEWLFGCKAPGIDLVLMLFAAGWAMLEVARPHLFDVGAFVGLSWMPDPYWFALHVALTLLHGIGLLRPDATALRVGAAFFSSWNWLFVSASLFRIEMTTGVLAYGILGMWALFGGVYLAGLPRRTA